MKGTGPEPGPAMVCALVMSPVSARIVDYPDWLRCVCLLSWLLERLWLEDCQSDQPGSASLLRAGAETLFNLPRQRTQSIGMVDSAHRRAAGDICLSEWQEQYVFVKCEGIGCGWRHRYLTLNDPMSGVYVAGCPSLGRGKGREVMVASPP